MERRWRLGGDGLPISKQRLRIRLQSGVPASLSHPGDVTCQRSRVRITALRFSEPGQPQLRMSGPQDAAVAVIDVDCLQQMGFGKLQIPECQGQHAEVRYVRYDPRGCGLSDADLRGQDLRDIEVWIDDLRRVVDSLHQERVVLLGLSQGGPVAIGFAARYPERVSHLILYGTYARGMKRRGDPTQADAAGLQVDLARVGWGDDKDDFRAVFARLFVPGAQSDEIDWFNDQLRSTTNSTNAPQLEAAFHDLDVSDRARRVDVPTLVLHAVYDRVVPFEEGRHLAGLIPGARFVALESRNHILLQRDGAFPRFISEIQQFTSQ